MGLVALALFMLFVNIIINILGLFLYFYKEFGKKGDNKQINCPNCSNLLHYDMIHEIKEKALESYEEVLF